MSKQAEEKLKLAFQQQLDKVLESIPEKERVDAVLSSLVVTADQAATKASAENKPFDDTDHLKLALQLMSSLGADPNKRISTFRKDNSALDLATFYGQTRFIHLFNAVLRIKRWVLDRDQRIGHLSIPGAKTSFSDCDYLEKAQKEIECIDILVANALEKNNFTGLLAYGAGMDVSSYARMFKIPKVSSNPKDAKDNPAPAPVASPVAGNSR